MLSKAMLFLWALNKHRIHRAPLTQKGKCCAQYHKLTCLCHRNLLSNLSCGHQLLKWREYQTKEVPSDAFCENANILITPWRTIKASSGAWNTVFRRITTRIKGCYLVTSEVGFRHLTAVGAFTDVNLAQSTLHGIAIRRSCHKLFEASQWRASFVNS